MRHPRQGRQTIGRETLVARQIGDGDAKNVRLCTSAASLGGTETLIIHPASMIFSHQSPAQLAAAGVEPGLLRLSVGLEHQQDIVDDLRSTLEDVGD